MSCWEIPGYGAYPEEIEHAWNIHDIIYRENSRHPLYSKDSGNGFAMCPVCGPGITYKFSHLENPIINDGEHPYLIPWAAVKDRKNLSGFVLDRAMLQCRVCDWKYDLNAGREVVSCEFVTGD